MMDPSKTGALPHVNTLMVGNTSMNSTEEPIVKDLVLIGAGHSHAFVLKSFGMRPERNVRLTIISDCVDTPYSGMLPGFVAGKYTREECHIDAVRLAEYANARLIIGRAVRIDKDFVEVEGQPDVPFDVCSVDVGSSPQLPQAGAELVSPVKPISRFSTNLERISERDKRGERLSIAIVGGGAGGVELLLAFHERFKNVREFVMIAKGDSLLPNHSPIVRKLVTEIITSRGNRICVWLGRSAEKVTQVLGNKVELEMHVGQSGETTKAVFDEVIWCTQACGQPMLAQSTGFKVNESGFVHVDDYLRVQGLTNIFAAGDCAHLVSNPCPKAGVFAVREGPPLTENLRRVLRGEDPVEKYIPQRTFLGLIGTGDGRAVASKGSMGVEGGWLWELKDWIDRKWMSGYTTMLMKPMVDETLSLVSKSSGKDIMAEMCDASMRCGGCGSKVGASILTRVLSDITFKTQHRQQVLLGLDTPDDCAMIHVGSDGVALQTVDFFRAFWRDEFVFAKIAANHSMSDVHAMGSTPVAALAIAQIPFAPSNKMEQRLRRLMQGTLAQLAEENCALVGGHTCEGAEVALGLSVTATTTMDEWIKKHRILTKSGMQPGDIIILTKPIGTGAIMAAHMRLLARGQWVYQAIQHMTVSNRSAGALLVDAGATACTDVTGFGLAGHLVEMIRASSKSGRKRLRISLDLDVIPILDGAIECVRDKHVVSSIHRDNARAARLVKDADLFVGDAVFTLLFDPQTSGGLIASVPQNSADECLRRLREHYPSASAIGAVEEVNDEGWLIQLSRS